MSVYPITAGDVLEAIRSGAREATLELLTDKDFATDAKLEQARALLQTLSTKDYATQATLAQVLARLEAIENQLETGDAKVQLKGQIEDLAANRPSPGTVPTGTVFWSVDTGDVSVSTGTEWRSLGVA